MCHIPSANFSLTPQMIFFKEKAAESTFPDNNVGSHRKELSCLEDVSDLDIYHFTYCT